MVAHVLDRGKSIFRKLFLEILFLGELGAASTLLLASSGRPGTPYTGRMNVGFSPQSLNPCSYFRSPCSDTLTNQDLPRTERGADPPLRKCRQLTIALVRIPVSGVKNPLAYINAIWRTAFPLLASALSSADPYMLVTDSAAQLECSKTSSTFPLLLPNILVCSVP
jgi:hypothetical protein